MGGTLVMDLLMLCLVAVLVWIAWAFVLVCGALMGPVDARPPSEESRP